MRRRVEADVRRGSAMLAARDGGIDVIALPHLWHAPGWCQACHSNTRSKVELEVAMAGVGCFDAPNPKRELQG